ncbi:hypothetical protein [Microcoleus sp. B4-D4]
MVWDILLQAAAGLILCAAVGYGLLRLLMLYQEILPSYGKT